MHRQPAQEMGADVSGHMHPDELTELQRHSVGLCIKQVCWYCNEARLAEVRMNEFTGLRRDRDAMAELARQAEAEAKTLCAQLAAAQPILEAARAWLKARDHCMVDRSAYHEAAIALVAAVRQERGGKK